MAVEWTPQDGFYAAPIVCRHCNRARKKPLRTRRKKPGPVSI